MKEIWRNIEVVAGVEPSTDATPQSTSHYTASQGIRFIDGKPHKLGGWQSVTFDTWAY